MTVRMIGSTVRGEIDHTLGDRIAVRTEHIGTQYVPALLLEAVPGSSGHDADTNTITRARLAEPHVDAADDVRSCPIASACRWCGNTAGVLTVPYELGTGVACGTTCPDCLHNVTPSVPPEAAAAVEQAILDHCRHLGLSRERMAELVAARYTDTS